jgi:hypothetical protein
MKRKKENVGMIRANTEKESITLIELTEEELESMRGGWHHNGDYGWHSYRHEGYRDEGYRDYGYRHDFGYERFDFRGYDSSCDSGW